MGTSGILFRCPELPTIDNHVFRNWKWRYLSEFHKTLQKRNSNTPDYVTFRPPFVSPSSRSDFYWLEDSGKTLTLHIDDISICPFDESLAGKKKILPCNGWLNGVFELHDRMGVQSFIDETHVVMIDGQRAIYDPGAVRLQEFQQGLAA